MIDLFKDKVYEELDDISQLVEPFEFAVNNELAQMPEEITLGQEFFENMLGYGGGRNNITQSVRKVVEREATNRGLETLSQHMRNEYGFVDKFFKVEIEEGSSYNAATKEFIGGVTIIKDKMAYEDKEIEKMLIDYMGNQFGNKLGRPSAISKPRLNEICDLFGAYDALKDRGARGKLNKLYTRYKTLIEERKLNIRDVELFKRFVDWNVKYVKNGSLPSMSNITKIKIMMRNELPIYSIKEEEV
jgi:hypothetical protein